jgi:hypothetical protein
MRHWSEDGIVWALKYLWKRVNHIQQYMTEMGEYSVDGGMIQSEHGGGRRRKRSNSLPSSPMNVNGTRVGHERKTTTTSKTDDDLVSHVSVGGGGKAGFVNTAPPTTWQQLQLSTNTLQRLRRKQRHSEDHQQRNLTRKRNQSLSTKPTTTHTLTLPSGGAVETAGQLGL